MGVRRRWPTKKRFRRYLKGERLRSLGDPTVGRFSIFLLSSSVFVSLVSSFLPHLLAVRSEDYLPALSSSRELP